MTNLKKTKNKKEQLRVVVTRYRGRKPAVVFFNTKGKAVPINTVEKVVISDRACFYAK